MILMHLLLGLGQTVVDHNHISGKDIINSSLISKNNQNLMFSTTFHS